MRIQGIATSVPCLQAPCILVRPLGGPRWLPTSSRSRRELREYLAGSDFLFLTFGRCGAWLITPDGLPLEVRVARMTRRALVP